STSGVARVFFSVLDLGSLLGENTVEEVSLVIGGEKRYLTQLWASDHTMSRILEECDDPKAFMEKLAGFAMSGFRNLEGEENSAIRHEGGETYRVWHKRGSLFRMVGFYETVHKRDFIALDAFTKSGQDYSKAQWKRIQEITRIKLDGQWKRKASESTPETPS